MWPDLGTLEPFWDSFCAFARSELDAPTCTFELEPDGGWRFVARDQNTRSGGRRNQLVFEPEENVLRFYDPETDAGWVMEDAFGGDPTEASNRL